MSDFLDLNDASPQHGELIPDGTFLPLRVEWIPGSLDEDPPDCPATDHGLFKMSTRQGSDAAYLTAEFTVLNGPYHGRKIRQIFVIYGGKRDADGRSIAQNISKSTLRAIVDSAFGLDPSDMSDGARAKRRLKGFRDIAGLEFVGRVGIEPGGPNEGGGVYPDKNRLAHVVSVTEPQWAAVRAGKSVPPAPSSHRPATNATQAQPSQPARPAWEAPAATAGAPPWQTSATPQTASAQQSGAPQQPPQSAPEAASTTALQGPAWLRGGN